MYKTILSASLLTLISAGAAAQAVAPGSMTPATPDMSPGQSNQVPRRPGSAKPLTPANPGAGSPERAYNELDADRDGNISSDEYGKLSLEAPYASIDTNGDGRVSEKEYRDGQQKRRPMGRAN